MKLDDSEQVIKTIRRKPEEVDMPAYVLERIKDKIEELLERIDRAYTQKQSQNTDAGK